jgi:ADP-ribosyl-[dinitrogen reductase] hydrolase
MNMQASRQNPQIAHRHAGCLLGGAVGDALGRPVEFMSIGEIRGKYGPAGIRDFAVTEAGIGAITDDTQMTLFTAEGLLREYHRTCGTGTKPDYAFSVYKAYLRWLHTQGESSRDPQFHDCLDGGLMDIPELNHRRAPGSTCLSALRDGMMGTVAQPVNTGKGCGGVMRVAPVGLFCNSLPEAGDGFDRARLAFDLGCEVAAITHGHPLGYLPAGFLSALICNIVSGGNLEKAISETMGILAERPERERCILSAQVNQASRLKRNKKPCPETIEKLGGGWVGDEALVISLYCALAAEGDFAKGVRLAVNHSGDSDSTGAIAGNILEVVLGKGKIPEDWLVKLEIGKVIEKTALDLFDL